MLEGSGLAPPCRKEALITVLSLWGCCFHDSRNNGQLGMEAWGLGETLFPEEPSACPEIPALIVRDSGLRRAVSRIRSPRTTYRHHEQSRDSRKQEGKLLKPLH